MKLSCVRPSVCPSVRPIRPPHDATASCKPGSQDISIDRCTAGGPAVNSSRAAAACGGRMHKKAVPRCHKINKLTKSQINCAVFTRATLC